MTKLANIGVVFAEQDILGVRAKLLVVPDTAVRYWCLLHVDVVVSLAIFLPLLRLRTWQQVVLE